MWYGRKQDIEQVDDLMQSLCKKKMAVLEKDSSKKLWNITKEEPTVYKKVYAVFLADGLYAFAPRVYVRLHFNHRDNKYIMEIPPKGLLALASKLPAIGELAEAMYSNGANGDE